MDEMLNCCICHSSIKPELNIFEEKIGDPPVPIIDVINECIDDFAEVKNASPEDIKDIFVCMRCSGKLLIYYKATLILKKIKSDLRALMEDTAVEKVIYEEDSQDCEIYEDSHNSLGELSQHIAEEVQKIEDYEEDYIKVEYIVDNPESFFNDSKGELEVDDVNALIKCEFSDTEIRNADINSAFDEIIEIEHLDEDIIIENAQESNSPKKKTTESMKTPLSCSECNIEFTTKRAYFAHRRHSHFAGFVCEQCGKTFYSQSGFITHVSTHKTVKEYVCTVCGEEYHHKNYLKRHMAWHSGEMPFACDICPKRFVHKVALYKHKKVHEDIRNIICAVCGFKFRTKAHLNRHMMTHTGAKPHSCPVCGKCFSQAYNMKVHIKEHEKPGSTRRCRFRCKRCAKTFSQKEKYEQHVSQNDCKYII